MLCSSQRKTTQLPNQATSENNGTVNNASQQKENVAACKVKQKDPASRGEDKRGNYYESAGGEYMVQYYNIKQYSDNNHKPTNDFTIAETLQHFREWKEQRITNSNNQLQYSGEVTQSAKMETCKMDWLCM